MKSVAKHVMEIPMILPRPQDNSVNLVLLGNYKVTRGKKKPECISLSGSLPNVTTTNSVTGKRSFQENVLAKAKSLAYIFIKDQKKGVRWNNSTLLLFPRVFKSCSGN